MMITAYCTASNGNSSQPGTAQRNVVLSHVKAPPPTPAVAATATTPAVAATKPAGPNDGLFDNPNAGQVTLNMNGITAAVKASFEEGAEYLVTIEKVAPAAS